MQGEVSGGSFWILPSCPLPFIFHSGPVENGNRFILLDISYDFEELIHGLVKKNYTSRLGVINGFPDADSFFIEISRSEVSIDSILEVAEPTEKDN